MLASRLSSSTHYGGTVLPVLCSWASACCLPSPDWYSLNDCPKALHDIRRGLRRSCSRQHATDASAWPALVGKDPGAKLSATGRTSRAFNRHPRVVSTFQKRSSLIGLERESALAGARFHACSNHRHFPVGKRFSKVLIYATIQRIKAGGKHVQHDHPRCNCERRSLSKSAPR